MRTTGALLRVHVRAVSCIVCASSRCFCVKELLQTSRAILLMRIVRGQARKKREVALEAGDALVIRRADNYRRRSADKPRWPVSTLTACVASRSRSWRALHRCAARLHARRASRSCCDMQRSPMMMSANGPSAKTSESFRAMLQFRITYSFLEQSIESRSGDHPAALCRPKATSRESSGKRTRGARRASAPQRSPASG